MFCIYCKTITHLLVSLLIVNCCFMCNFKCIPFVNLLKDFVIKLCCKQNVSVTWILLHFPNFTEDLHNNPNFPTKMSTTFTCRPKLMARKFLPFREFSDNLSAHIQL